MFPLSAAAGETEEGGESDDGETSKSDALFSLFNDEAPKPTSGENKPQLKFTAPFVLHFTSGVWEITSQRNNEPFEYCISQKGKEAAVWAKGPWIQNIH